MLKEQKVLVVGAGIFGVTVAVRLARKGYAVELRDQGLDILLGASGRNQFRLHLGFHYPRSLETAIGCKESRDSFLHEYGDALLPNSEHFYCISGVDSLVGPKQFLDFCTTLGAPYEIVNPSFISENVPLTIKVPENIVDPVALRSLCWAKLKDSKVKVQLGQKVTQVDLKEFDKVVVCTYTDLNSLLGTSTNFQYEVCEKLLVRLPPHLRDKSIVVLDGSFMCVDPYGNTGLHQLAHVQYTVRDMWVGLNSDPSQRWSKLLQDQIVLSTPEKGYLESLGRYVQGAANLDYVGSLFALKVVLPHMESTDSRPTLVTKVSERVVSVFSGKIGNCVQAADQVGQLLGEMNG